MCVFTLVFSLSLSPSSGEVLTVHHLVYYVLRWLRACRVRICTVQVIIKQKVQLKTTLAGLAELDSLHTHFEAGGGCAVDKFLWETIPDSDTIWEERLPVHTCPGKWH